MGCKPVIRETPFEMLLSLPLRNGLTKPKAQRGTGVKMISMGELFSSDRIGHMPMDRVPVTDRELELSSIVPADLLFARQSLVLEGAGKCCLVKEVSEPTVFESHLIRARVDRSKAEPEYLYYFFKSPQGRERIASIVEQVAAAGIRGKDLAKLNIPCPELDFQHRVVGLLSCIDDKIDANTKLNGYLEDYASCLFEDFASECISSTPLFEVANVCYGKGLATKNFIDSGYPVFGGNGQIGFYSKYLYEDPQILVSCRGAAAGNILVSSPKSFVTSNSLVIELNDRRYFEWLKRYLLLHQLHGYATGSAQPQITIDNLKYLTVPYPPLSEIEELTRILSTISDYVYSNEIENASLAQLRDTLLPKLISGEIDVSKVTL